MGGVSLECNLIFLFLEVLKFIMRSNPQTDSSWKKKMGNGDAALTHKIAAG